MSFSYSHNKSEVLERKLNELNARLQVQSKEGGKVGLNALVIELQQQNSDLKCNLSELMRQNEQLEAKLSQKQVELDFVKHNQSKLLRAKEEVMSCIKTSRPNGDLEDIVVSSRDLEQVSKNVLKPQW